jgi:hypothetical protein
MLMSGVPVVEAVEITSSVFVIIDAYYVRRAVKLSAAFTKALSFVR